MLSGESLTRGTVWLALVLFVAGQVALARGSRHAARWLNTAGCAAFLAHVGCAFHFYHAWSHAAAYADTARQTATMFGWNWGGGLFFNYAFALAWLGQVLASWRRRGVETRRPGWFSWMFRGFFLFMMVNGAVVFAHGPLRWLGAALCVLLATSWWRAIIGDR